MPTVPKKLINLAEAYTESFCRPQTWILESHTPGIIYHKKAKNPTPDYPTFQSSLLDIWDMGYSINLCNSGILGTLTETYK